MTVRYEMEFNEEDIRHFTELVKEVYTRAVAYVAQDVWGNIKREAPVNEGRLAGSFDLEKLDDYAWRIYTNVHYALFVHEGTGIYGPVGQRIVPVSASVLVFEWMGRTWFLKSVAGQEPNPYADRAMDTSAARIDEFVNTAISELGGAV